MCDTLVVFDPKNEGHSFFAKNSDREPGELQVVYLSIDPVGEFEHHPYLESVPKYLQNSLPVLQAVFSKFHHPYRAIISRPVWMWGGEIGVNEFGLAIGNEAVFSREKVPDQGLLGMDILRLALHNSKTAKEALDLIIRLIQEYKQGGNGGYHQSLKYFNSFLLKDAVEGYVLETSGPHWAARKIDTFGTISNSYTITGDFDLADSESGKAKSFKGRYENPLLTFFSQGNQRQQYSSNNLAEHGANLTQIKALLRSHRDSSNQIRRGMNSICNHSGMIKSETTSSLIADYSREQVIVWFTGSPHPCVSLYKPVAFPAAQAKGPMFTDIKWTVAYCEKQRVLARKLVRHYDVFQKYIKPLRDEYENEFSKLVHPENPGGPDLSERCFRCYDLEEEYLKKVEKLL